VFTPYLSQCLFNLRYTLAYLLSLPCYSVYYYSTELSLFHYKYLDNSHTATFQHLHSFLNFLYLSTWSFFHLQYSFYLGLYLYLLFSVHSYSLTHLVPLLSLLIQLPHIIITSLGHS
jgi:hypothetical protein